MAAIVSLIAGAAIGLTPPASAADYYVGGGSCSDAGPGTLTTPYCTITAALAAHHGAGTTLNVLPGVYREQVTLPASGAAGSPLTLRALGAPDQPVVIDGADDFSDPARWVEQSGDVWLAATVTWSPVQVFVDGVRLTRSGAAPADLAPGSFVYVAGTGLYVNAGGNPGLRQAAVGHRAYGFYLAGRSWVTLDGFTITRNEDRGVELTGSSNVEVLHNVISLAGRYGIQASGCSAIGIRANLVFVNGDHGIALTAGSTGCTLEDNESFRNVFAAQRQANGIYLYNAPGNLIQR
ncbi:MAG: right-handed parallel beta-helix repeat-containing protein, partial [Candidatus Eisenbacteria bacterium]